MGSSLYEKTTLPSSSATMTNDRHHHTHEQHEMLVSPSLLSPSSGNGHARRNSKSSHPNNIRTRSKTKNNDDINDNTNISVTDSMAKFLAESEDEDLMFINTNKNKNSNKNSNKNKNTTDKRNGEDGGNIGNDKKGVKGDDDDDDDENDYDYHNDDDDDVTVQSEALFDRNALMRAGKPSSKRSKSRSRSKSKLNIGGSKKELTRDERSRRKKKTERDERGERRQERRTSRTAKDKNKKKDRNRTILDNSENNITDDSNDEIDNDNDNNSVGSFAIDTGEESEITTISSSDSKQTSYRSKQRGLRSTPRLPSRTQSLNKGQAATSKRFRQPPRRARSFHAGNDNNNTNNANNANKGYQNVLSVGLQDLDRQVRRDRMKRGYRSPSFTCRNNRRQDGADGGESVASGTSLRSSYTTNTAYSSRSFKQSGLEGGALNAFMGNEHISRNTSRVMSPPADEKYLKERKARQDLIMDVAVKEKWRHEAEATKEAERVEKEKFSTEYYSSDEEIGTKKKKGLVKKMKRAACKTAKLSRSGAKGAANVVKDPKRAAKKAGKVASQVGKETVKMVKDPSLVAKRGTKGIKGTVNLTANVAKGGFDVTSYLTRKGIKGTAKVVGGTIDGAGRVVYGATDLIFNHDGNEEVDEVLEDYDPRALSDRQRFRETFADRLTIHDNSIGNGKNIERLDSGGSKILFPVMDLNGTSASKPKKGWWDI